MGTPAELFQEMLHLGAGIKHPADVIALAAHACMVNRGFSISASAANSPGMTRKFFKTPQGHIGQIILDANWNASPEMYTFVYYKHPTEPIPFNDPAFQVGPRYRHPITVHMKGMRIADKIALNVVAQGTAASMRSMELRVQDYCDANSIATGNFNKANQKANELLCRPIR
eukprot:GHVU01042317.1.p1 GENE.GHVU01042317.1~~GHVU01042317.1.p1  ORF type:complete len:171 (+),score=20.58 GHVU01042317.1:82-594(+)